MCTGQRLHRSSEEGNSKCVQGCHTGMGNPADVRFVCAGGRGVRHAASGAAAGPHHCRRGHADCAAHPVRRAGTPSYCEALRLCNSPAYSLVHSVSTGAFPLLPISMYRPTDTAGPCWWASGVHAGHGQNQSGCWAVRPHISSGPTRRRGMHTEGQHWTPIATLSLRLRRSRTCPLGRWPARPACPSGPSGS